MGEGKRLKTFLVDEETDYRLSRIAAHRGLKQGQVLRQPILLGYLDLPSVDIADVESEEEEPGGEEWRANVREWIRFTHLRKEGEMAAGLDPCADLEKKPQTIAEARLAIKHLRLRKKQLSHRKREIGLEMEQITASYRDRLAGRTESGFGHRVPEGRMRRLKGELHQALWPLRAEKWMTEQSILKVEEALLDLEAFVEHKRAKS